MGVFFALTAGWSGSEQIPDHKAREWDQKDSCPDRRSERAGARLHHRHETPDVHGPRQKQRKAAVLDHLGLVPLCRCFFCDGIWREYLLAFKPESGNLALPFFGGKPVFQNAGGVMGDVGVATWVYRNIGVLIE